MEQQMQTENKGQTLVEFTVSLSMMILLITFVFVALTSLNYKMILKYWTYQTTVCLLERQGTTHCKKKLVNKLTTLPYFKIKDINLRLSRKEARSYVEAKLFNKIHLTQKKVIAHDSY